MRASTLVTVLLVVLGVAYAGDLSEKLLEIAGRGSHEVAQRCPNNCSGHGRCVRNSCVCNSGWGGYACNYEIAPITPGTPVVGQLRQTEWAFYYVSTSQMADLVYSVHSTQGSDCDLYVRRSGAPTLSTFDKRDISLNADFELEVDNAAAGTWFAGVYSYSATCQFTMELTLNSTCPNNGCGGHGSCSNGECTCNAGYAGDGCEYQLETVASGDTKNGALAWREWAYYALPISAHETATVSFTETAPPTVHDCDVYAGLGFLPNATSFTTRNMTTRPASEISVEADEDGTLFVGMRGYRGCHYVISFTTSGGDNGCHSAEDCSLHGVCQAGSCHCNAGFSGQACETMTSELAMSTRVAGYVGDADFNYYHFTGQSQHAVQISLVQQSRQGDCDLLVKAGSPPTFGSFDYYNGSLAPESSLVIDDPVGSTWYVGVYGFTACAYNVSVAEVQQCSCNGRGVCSPEGECECNTGYAGDHCQYPVRLITSQSVINGTVPPSQWAYFRIHVRRSTAVSAYLRELSTLLPPGNVWLFLRAYDPPTLTEFDASSLAPHEGLHHAHLVFEEELVNADVFIGIYGSEAAGPMQMAAYRMTAIATDF